MKKTNLHKLIQFGDVQKDLLFWMKKFLIYKLGTLDQSRVKDDFDISKYYTQIKTSETIEDVRKVANEIKPSIGAFYALANNLIKFYEFLPSMKLESITEVTNSIFYDDFIGRHLNSASSGVKANAKSGVKMLFEFIELHNAYYENDVPYLFNITKNAEGKTIPLRRLKASKHVPLWLNENELKMLNEWLLKYKGYKNTTYGFDRARNILMMKILIYSGITASELVNLKLEDITETEAFSKKYIGISIKNSNNQDRDIPILRGKIIRYLNAYLELRDNKEVDYLFYSPLRNNEQMKTQFVLDALKKYIEKSGITKSKITTEMLRTSHAILLGNLGAETLYVKERLGYKTMTATKEVLSYCNKKALEASKKFALINNYL